jgi:hypothetical protein
MSSHGGNTGKIFIDDSVFELKKVVIDYIKTP